MVGGGRSSGGGAGGGARVSRGSGGRLGLRGGAGAVGGGGGGGRRGVAGTGGGVVGALDHEGRGVVGVGLVGVVDDLEGVVGAADDVLGDVPGEGTRVGDTGCEFGLVWFSSGQLVSRRTSNGNALVQVVAGAAPEVDGDGALSSGLPGKVDGRASLSVQARSRNVEGVGAV